MTTRFTKLDRILSDPLRKSLPLMVLEFGWESLKNGRIAKEYFSRFCYRKGGLPLKNFVSDHAIGVLQMSRIVHSDVSAHRMINKVEFYRFCKEHNLPTPKVVAYTVQSDFLSLDEELHISNLSDFTTACTRWILASPHQSIFIKPVDGKGGHGAYRIHQDELKDESLLKEVYEAMVNSDYILQETVIQHPVVNAISPASINTLRVDTYIPKGEKSRVMSACMRFGRTGFVVDNPASSGGFFAAISMDGVLHAPGLQMLGVGNETYTHHPDTKVALEGIQIPFFQEALNLVNKACELSEDRLVGWDVCIGPDGPIIIEGNHNYHIVLQEVAYGGYLNHPDFIRVLKEENLI